MLDRESSNSRIGLIADTHILQDGVEPPHQVAEIFEGVNLILHAGDLIVLSVLDWLEKVAPVLAVRGNGDSGLPADPRLAETRTLTVCGKRIGLCHNLDTRSDLQNTMERYFGGKVDIIVFGDTHVAGIETHQGILVINPGSPSIPRGLVGVPGTVGMIDIIGGTVEGRIIQLG
ncbi:metallophosphoesterase family protein [Chloroflexota bacterium]